MFTAKRLHKLTTKLRRCRANVKRTTAQIAGAKRADKKTAGLEKKLAKARNQLVKVADAQNRILERIAGKWTPFSQAEKEAETRVAFVTFNHARRSSAEHLIATKVLRCTATAWILIVAQCSAIP